jgi:hypothetical protein
MDGERRRRYLRTPYFRTLSMPLWRYEQERDTEYSACRYFTHRECARKYRVQGWKTEYFYLGPTATAGTHLRSTVISEGGCENLLQPNITECRLEKSQERRLPKQQAFCQTGPLFLITFRSLPINANPATLAG